MKNYDNVVIFDHPLIRHKIAILRDENTSMKEFRELVEEITTLMTYECLKDGVPTVEKEVKTPLETCTQRVVKEHAVAIVPILRAGLGMVNGIHVLFPLARVGHIGMYRDEETLEAYRRLTGGYYQRNDDLKTFEQNSHTMRREMMHRLAKRSGTWWFDMLEGWYYDDKLMDEVNSLAAISRMMADKPSYSASEIAVFVCSESLYYVNKHSHITDINF